MTSSERLWSVPVRVDRIPEGGRDFALHADVETRQALARTAGVLDISRLDAAFDVTRAGRDGVRVSGTVSARVRQTCAVTLEPLDSDIAETVDLVFLPQDQAAASTAASHEVAPDAPDPPEPIVDGVLDLGAIATEFLILGIDPYPRKPGAVFASQEPAEDAAAHPFAALAALAKGGRKDDR